jgi:predicted phosphodiesterase
MNYAIISDVHANLEALKAVSEKLREEDFDSLLFLGDSIGYGPNPNECI